MFEPRILAAAWVKNPSVTFLGGTPEFDLWYFGAFDANDLPKSHLRIVGVDDAQWDIWYHNKLAKGAGVLNCITLTPEQEESIETYLRCFAPWVLASRSEEQT